MKKNLDPGDALYFLWTLLGSTLKRQNNSSALGYLWWLFDPVLMTAVYRIVLVVLFQRGGKNQPSTSLVG